MDKNQQKQTNRDSRTMLTEFKDVSIHFFFLSIVHLKENRNLRTECFYN